MKKTMIIFAIALGFNSNAQESRDEMLGRADMITFASGVTYVADFGLSLTDAFKDKREARFATTMSIGLGLGVLKEVTDVYCFEQRFNGGDVLYMMGGALIGFAMSEATQAVIEFTHKKKRHKLKL